MRIAQRVDRRFATGSDFTERSPNHPPAPGPPLSEARCFNSPMPSPTQMRFWPDARPLVERLGRDFFRGLPPSPGVYFMRDANDTVLYVGKAANLRRRLGDYRVANPDHLKRRTLRLLTRVERITWEECPDEATALLREAELLLELKPRFNRAGVWRGPRRLIGWRCRPDGLELAVMGVEDAIDDGWQLAGPFGAGARHLHRALVRLFWCRLNSGVGLAAMPAGWWRGLHGLQVVLSGDDSGLVNELNAGLRRLVDEGDATFFQELPPVVEVFEQELREEDVERITNQLAGTRFDSQVANTPDPEAAVNGNRAETVVGAAARLQSA